MSECVCGTCESYTSFVLERERERERELGKHTPHISIEVQNSLISSQMSYSMRLKATE